MSDSTVKALPLQGRRILVTRTREQAGTLSERLLSLGAVPVEFPTIRIVPPQDWEPLDNALRHLCASCYDWLVFTSTNGVNICFDRLRTLGYQPGNLGNALRRMRRPSAMGSRRLRGRRHLGAAAVVAQRVQAPVGGDRVQPAAQ